MTTNPLFPLSVFSLFLLISFLCFVPSKNPLIFTKNFYSFQHPETTPTNNQISNFTSPSFSEKELKIYNQIYSLSSSPQPGVTLKNPDPLRYKMEYPIDQELEKKLHKDALSQFPLNFTPKLPFNKTSRLTIPPPCDEGIDAVWLWVNGSDPFWKTKFQKYGFQYEPDRFRDFNSLMFSMRSVYKYLPYINNFHVITDDQVPDFLEAPVNLSAFKITKKNYSLQVISHKQLFRNVDLPNFNSDAIETLIHKIPNLAECFVYLNDDFVFTDFTPPQFFIQKSKIQIYTENTLAPDERWTSQSKWHNSIAIANQKLNAFFKLPLNTKRPYISHSAYFFRKSLMQKLEQSFTNEFKTARTKKVRAWDAVNIPFLATHFSKLSGEAEYVKVEGWTYFWILNENHMASIMNKIRIEAMKPYCICVNDDFGESFGAEKEIRYLLRWYNEILPDKEIFEKGFKNWF